MNLFKSPCQKNYYPIRLVASYLIAARLARASNVRRTMRHSVSEDCVKDAKTTYLLRASAPNQTRFAGLRFGIGIFSVKVRQVKSYILAERLECSFSCYCPHGILLQYIVEVFSMPENVFLIPKKETTAPADYELRVAAYCRVSTIREEQLGSLENQIAYYTHYISDKPGWRLVSAYYDRASGVSVGSLRP